MLKNRTTAWIIWSIASIFYAYQYILRVMPNIMLDSITKQFNIDATVFGQYSGIYYIGYCLMHLPIGILLDKYGPRKIMTLCTLLTVMGLLPLIFSNTTTHLIIGRFLIGMGSSAAILGVFKIIRLAFEERQFTKMLSLSVMIGLIGTIYGGGPVNYLCLTIGDDMVVKIFAVMGMVLATLCYAIVPDIKNEYQGSMLNGAKEVLSNYKVILSCIFAGFMVGPLEGFADVWGSKYLSIVYDYNSTLAASVVSLIYVGMCFGSPVLSFIAQRTSSYNATIVSAGIAMLAVFTALIFECFNVNVMSICFVLVGVFSAYQILAIYKVSTYVNPNLAGVTTALANMIIMSFGYGFHSIIGLVINYTQDDLVKAYTYGISVIPIALIIGVIGYFIVSVSKQYSKDGV